MRAQSCQSMNFLKTIVSSQMSLEDYQTNLTNNNYSEKFMLYMLKNV